MEINPDHQVTQAMRDQWMKICAIIIHKYKLDPVEITVEDIKAVPPDTAVIIHTGRTMKSPIRITLTNREIAEKMGHNGRKAVEERHSWSHRAKEIHKIICSK